MLTGVWGDVSLCGCRYCVQFQLGPIPSCRQVRAPHAQWTRYLTQGHTVCVRCEWPAQNARSRRCYGDGGQRVSSRTWAWGNVIVNSGVSLLPERQRGCRSEMLTPVWGGAHEGPGRSSSCLFQLCDLGQSHSLSELPFLHLKMQLIRGPPHGVLVKVKRNCAN